MPTIATKSPAEHWLFPFCPEPPDYGLGWDTVRARYPWLDPLAECPQDPLHHAEGDVLTHTRMVVEALSALPAWRVLSPADRAELFAAALLHDIAKPACTVIEPDGRVGSPGHARRGAGMARQALWLREPFGERPVPFRAREGIVALVCHHGLPLWFLERDDPARAVIAASLVARLDRVALLAEADARGRLCQDLPDLLARIDLFREFAREHGCLDKPYPFASAHSRFAYFRKEGRDPAYRAYDDTRCEAVLMSGLPGSGKNTWVEHNLPDWPVVSLDALRQQLRVSPDEDQGRIVAAAKEEARGHLRAGRSFVWNATNTTRRTRDGLIGLFAAYNARVRIVYVEAPLDELLRRNGTRPAPVPERAILRLAEGLEVPDPTEAHHVDYVLTDGL